MLFLPLLLLMGGLAGPDLPSSDVCIYGGTAAGVVAAVQCRAMGHSVILLEPGRHIGGMTTGGLGATDIGNKEAIGGLSREFYRALGQHYGQPEAWKFEPHVAEEVLNRMLVMAGVDVRMGERLRSVVRQGGVIKSINMASSRRYRAKEFIDATYEGDLMAAAGVSYTVGRESNALYGETLNGVRAETPFHQFKVRVDPYRVSGNSASGLIPWVQSGTGRNADEGDRCIQAYNLRLCFTTNASNRLPLERPRHYDPKRYELLARYLEAVVRSGHDPKLAELWNPIWMPNGKTDINNNGPVSTDLIGFNYEYPDGDEATRARILELHQDYTRGFCYFLATSPRVPVGVRAEMNQFGPCKDEFVDSGGWPTQLYIREARRMLTDTIMTEKECRGLRVVPDPVGLAAYNMDSHNCQRLVHAGAVLNEGDVQVPPMKPYGISYRSIVPRKAECANLVVPVCLAASHIAYGSIRMEPVFMILGQSAATAACFAVDESTALQDVDYARLRARLIADGQVLEWKQ